MVDCDCARLGLWLVCVTWCWRKIVESSADFCVDSPACVRVGKDVSEWFLVNVALRLGYGWCGAKGDCKGALETAGTAAPEWY